MNIFFIFIGTTILLFSTATFSRAYILTYNTVTNREMKKGIMKNVYVTIKYDLLYSVRKMYVKENGKS